MTTEQLTFGGKTYTVIEEQTDPPKNGFALVLYHARPDSDWQKLAEWHQRLEREGLL